MHLYYYSIVDVVAFFAGHFVDLVSSPHRVDVPCAFQFVQVVFKVTSGLVGS